MRFGRRPRFFVKIPFHFNTICLDLQAVSHAIGKKGKFFFRLHILFKEIGAPCGGLLRNFRAGSAKGRRGVRRGKIHMNLRTLLGGSFIGAANGLFGGGGGMIAVPVLEGMGRPARSAHATAIAVILPASAVSAAVYVVNGFVPLSLLLPVAGGVLLGGLAGAKLLARVSGRAAAFLFAGLMLAAGLRLLF